MKKINEVNRSSDAKKKSKLVYLILTLNTSILLHSLNTFIWKYIHFSQGLFLFKLRRYDILKKNQSWTSEHFGIGLKMELFIQTLINNINICTTENACVYEWRSRSEKLRPCISITEKTIVGQALTCTCFLWVKLRFNKVHEVCQWSILIIKVNLNLFRLNSTC